MMTTQQHHTTTGGDEFTRWKYPGSIAEVEPQYRRTGTPLTRCTITSPHEAYNAFLLVWDTHLLEYLESMYVLLLDGAQAINGFSVVGQGTGTHCVVQTQKLLTLGLITGSLSLILAHNHPSGNLTPSDRDYAFTTHIATAASLVGLTLLDHLIIVSGEGASVDYSGFHSLRGSAPHLFASTTAQQLTWETT